MKYLLILLLVFPFSLNAAESCGALKEYAESKVERYNKLFGKATRIVWHSKAQWQHLGQPPSIFGAHMSSKGNISLLDFCGQKFNSPKNVIDYIVAHEFIHTVVDKNDRTMIKCFNEVARVLGEKPVNDLSPNSGKIYDHFHAHHVHNIETITFKLLNSQGHDLNKIVQSVLANGRLQPGMGSRVHEIYKKRFARISKSTSFADGLDIPPLAYFSGEGNFEKFLSEAYPKSTFLKDAKGTAKQTRARCYVPDKETLTQALKNYQRGGNSPTSESSEENAAN